MTRKGCYLLGGFGVVAEFLTKIHPGVRVRLMLQRWDPVCYTHTYLYIYRNASIKCALWSSLRKMGWFQMLQVTGIQLRSPQTGNVKKIIRYIKIPWSSYLH